MYYKFNKEKVIMCNCKNIEIGSYDNQVELKAPQWSSYKTICVDSCLKDEILYLWSVGIRTTGCCCGHNKLEPFVGVFDEDIPKMKELGYQVQYNSCRPKEEDSFKPKTKY